MGALLLCLYLLNIILPAWHAQVAILGQDNESYQGAFSSAGHERQHSTHNKETCAICQNSAYNYPLVLPPLTLSELPASPNPKVITEQCRYYSHHSANNQPRGPPLA